MHIKHILSLAATVALALLASCEPEEPTNEVNNKLHGDPVAATLTLEAGTVTDGLFTVNPLPKEGQRAVSTQSITFRLQEHGWMPISPRDTAFFVLKDQAYRLSIRYTDARDQDITGDFIRNGQDAIHQHFFRLRAFKPLLGETLTAAEKKLNSSSALATDALIPQLLEYHYADTNPWDGQQDATGSNITGENPQTGALINPVGMKGWLRFTTENRHLKLQIDLMHARTSKYNKSVCSPYYQPSARQRISDHWDVQMAVPIVSLTDLNAETKYLQKK